MVDQLVEALERKRGSIPVALFAKDLGIHFSTYYRLLKGERGLGADLQERIIRRYPDLALVFLQRFSSADDGESSGRESATESPQPQPETR